MKICDHASLLSFYYHMYYITILENSVLFCFNLQAKSIFKNS